MLITIPTYGRSTRQITWGNLPESVRKMTLLVVQKREEHLYAQYPHLVLPDNIRDIGLTRDWIVGATSDEYLVMLDDDLEFAVRRVDNPTLLRPAKAVDVESIFETLRINLHDQKHVGIASREGANRCTDENLWNTRAMRVLAYRSSAILDNNLRFADGGFMCDFHMTLSLLELGYPNCVMNWCTQNQIGGSNAPGGCSETRTVAAQAEAAHNLRRLHPQFVTVVEKTTKTAWGGGTRTDVRIAWKEALKYGKSRQTNLLDNGAGEDTTGEGGGAAEAVE